MIIYKYLPKESALKTIENGSVLLRCPLEYNDPFDCLFFSNKTERKKAFQLFMNYELFEFFYNEMIVNNKKTERLKNQAKIIKKQIQLIAKNIRLNNIYKSSIFLTSYYQTATKILKKSDKELKIEFDKFINDAFKKMRDSVLASCFGSTFDSLLMWSHYAEKHQGACIEFEVDENDFKPIKYSNTIPLFPLSHMLEIALAERFLDTKLKLNKEDERLILEPIFVKSAVWSYEGEYRCVFSKKQLDERIYYKDNSYFLRMQKINRIFVGCKADERFIESVRKEANGIPAFKMKMSDTNYALIVGDSIYSLK